MNPIHITTYMGNNREELYRFQQELVKITPFYDFSPPSSVTTNNYYFYETSHYRPLVGDWMIQKILKMDNRGLSKDFGVYVMEENIEEQVNFARFRAEEYVNHS